MFSKFEEILSVEKIHDYLFNESKQKHIWDFPYYVDTFDEDNDTNSESDEDEQEKNLD
jgi:hypothetical protein